MEQLTAMLDHIPDRPAIEAYFAVVTPANTLALLIKPHGKQGQGLVKGMWAIPTDVCGCNKSDMLMPGLSGPLLPLTSWNLMRAMTRRFQFRLKMLRLGMRGL